MATNEVLPAQSTVPELTWVGHGAWIACDPGLDASDPRRAIAYLECSDHRVYVLWVRDRHDVSCYDTLREAVRAVGEAPPAAAGEAPAPAGAGRIRADRSRGAL